MNSWEVECTQANLLELLLTAISEIDGGCSRCIGAFTQGANEALSAAGVPLRFLFDPDCWDEPRVILQKLEDSQKDTA